MTKHCGKCNIEKDESDFAPSRPSWCRNCLMLYQREWRKRNPEKAKASRVAHRTYNRAVFESTGGPPLRHKICSICKIDKPASDFQLDRGRKGGLCVACKLCNNYFVRYQNARQRDKLHNQTTCTKPEWYEIIRGNCTYCDYAESLGADRIDNTKGHSADNIVPCCDWCNAARQDHFTTEEMKTFIGPAIKSIRENRRG